MLFIKKSEFECKREKLTIHGYMFKPVFHSGKKKLAPVILSHGFMADWHMCERYAEIFAKWGYAAFVFDFNGGGLSCRSDGPTEKMSVLTEIQDLDAVRNYVSSLEFIDISKLILLGCSQGGAVSALYAARNPSKLEKLVLFYPALCIPDDARSGHMLSAHFDPKNVPETVKCGSMTLGSCYINDVIDMDIFKEIEPWKGPVCILHGDQDSIVNLRYSQQAIEVYRKDTAEGDNSKQLFVIKDGGHVFDRMHDKIAVSNLKQYLASFK